MQSVHVMGAPACIRLGQRCAHSSTVCAFEAGSCLKQGVLRGHVCSWCHTSVRSEVTLKSPKLVLGQSKFSFVSQLLHEALRKPQLQDTVLGTVQMCTLKVSKNCTHDAVKGEAWLNSFGRFGKWQHFLHGRIQDAESTTTDRNAAS